MITRAEFLKRVGGLFAIAMIEPRTLVTNELPHPEPRPDINGDHVLTTEALGEQGKKKSIMNAYDAARENPAIFDGIACGCGCTEHNGPHRSLLVCYETQQPVGCGGCREEAVFVAGLVKDKKTLAEIRKAVDKKFG